MATDIKPNWQRVLDDSIIKMIGKERRKLLPLFCEGRLTQEITEVIRHFLLSNTTLGSFSLSALFCFSERYDKPVKFFQIFYNDTLKTNEAVWRAEDVEFCAFRECLIYYLVSQFCKKRNLNIKRQIKSPDKISDNELKKIINDEDVLTFIKQLNQVKFFEIRSWLSGSVRSGIDDAQTLLERDIGELLFLMHNNREILEPHLKGSAFAKFFPDKSRNIDSLQSILKNQVTSLISIYALRFTLKNIINEEIGRNNNIACFTENNGKFYRVLRFTESSKDAALHDKHQNVKLDVESSSDYWFEQLWIVKNVKEKIYFPEVDAETVFRKSYERFNSYLTRNVEYLDENLGREVLLKDAKLYVDKESLLKFLESQKKTTPTKSNHINERKFVEYLKSEIAKSPDTKPFPKISTKGQNSYEEIALKNYQIKLKRFLYCWKEATKELPKNHPWIKAGARKKL